MLTLEYAGAGFGLAAFGQITLEKLLADLDVVENQSTTETQFLDGVVTYLMALSESDRKTAIGLLRARIAADPDPDGVAMLAEIERRVKEAERGVLAKYWWLWTALGVAGVTAFGLIVYRGTRKSKRRC